MNSRAAPTTPAVDVTVIPLAIFVGSCLLYMVNIDRPPDSDELYHLLAARGLIEHGEPRIADGLYTRVLAYTWLIAQSFAVLGESLMAARLPSLAFMASLNVLLFVWLRRETGRTAAILATGLFALSPFAVEIAQFARFYALQSLLFFIGAIALYELARRRPALDSRTIGGSAVLLLSLAFATYLQPTTLIGVLGLGLWLVTAVGVPWLFDPAVPRHRKAQAVGIALIAGVIAIGVLFAIGVVGELWHRYRWTPVFLSPRADEFWFYYLFYFVYYPSLWPVIGLLCLAALASWPRPTWFAMVIFVTGFLLNSFAGPKNLRYIAYAQPFMFILFGLGLAAAWPWLANAAGTFKDQLETQLKGINLAGWQLPRLVLWGSVLVVVLANAALLRTVASLANITVPPQNPDVRWQAARPHIATLLDEVEVVVTMVELPTLYFWERYDVLFSPSRLSEMAGKGEFDADFRTGRPVISTTDSLARLVDCTASGLFVATAPRWRQAQFIDPETVAYIEGGMTQLDLPERSQLLVFQWTQVLPPETDPSCATLHELLAATE